MPATRTAARSIALIAGLTCVSLGFAGAADAKKPRAITVPAHAVQSPTSKLCMPKSVLGTEADKSLPTTLCLTRDEWIAKGLIIIVK